MKIKLLESLTRLGNAGDTVEVSDREGKRFISGGQAEEVKAGRPPKSGPDVHTRTTSKKGSKKTTKKKRK